MKKILLFLLLSFTLTSFSQNIPSPIGYVNDFANIIDDNKQSELESQLSQYEDSTSIEVAVVTISDLEGYDVFDYSQKLFENWGIGKKETNAGLLVLIAPNDRKWRIHTGYGLEPFITDYNCKKIGEKHFPSNFKSGDYTTGIILGVNGLISKLGNDSWELRQEYLAEQKRAEAERAEKFKQGFMNFLLILLVVVLVIVAIAIKRRQILKQKALEKDIKYYKSSISKIKNRVMNIIAGKDITSNRDYFSKTAKELLSTLDESVLKTNSFSEEYLDKIKMEYKDFNGKFVNLNAYMVVDRKVNLQESMIDGTKKSLNFKVKKAIRKYDDIKKSAQNGKYYVETYLGKFITDEDYYTQKYIDSVEKTIKLAKTKVDTQNFSAAHNLYNKFEDIQSKLKSKLDKVYNFENELNTSIANLAKYEKEIIANKDTLYSKTYKKVNHSDVRKSTVRKWNDLQKKLNSYITITKNKSDVVMKSSVLMELINELRSTKRRAQSDIDDARRERERAAALAAAALASRRSSSSSSSSWGSSSWGSGSSGFGGFGGGSSGGGGASGSW